MTRLLAWCAGSTLGLVVGFLAGTVVRDRADVRELRQRALMMGATPAERARARQVPPIRRASAPVRPVEARNAGRGTSGRAGEGTPARAAIPAQRACPATLGRLTCERVGTHAEHWWTVEAVRS